jgi:hypothetical protein
MPLLLGAYDSCGCCLHGAHGLIGTEAGQGVDHLELGFFLSSNQKPTKRHR